jgi:hypothetical protein
MRGNGQDPEKRLAQGHALGLQDQAAVWTTPQAHDAQGGNPERVRRYGTLHGAANLADDVTMWPTPDVCSGARDMSKVDPVAQRRPETHRTVGLPTAALAFPSSPPAPPTAPPGPPSSPPGPTSPPLWPTPVQEDSQVTGWWPNKDASGQSLNATAQLWKTPRGQDAKHQEPTDYELTLGPESGNSRLLHVQIGRLTGEKRRLNPRFVSWLMGLPPGWLDAQSSCGQEEMASYRSRLRSRLASLFDVLL